MKKQVTQKKCFNKKPGFTLVETAIAMGMVAVMISSFMVVFGPALRGIDKSLSAKEADRLSRTLNFGLSVLNAKDAIPDDVNDSSSSDAQYTSGFHKAFDCIRNGNQDSLAPGKKNLIVLVYQYRGDPNKIRPDGTLEPWPYNVSDQTPGRDYILQSVMRFATMKNLDDNIGRAVQIREELAPGVLEGKVYYVKLTQLIFYDPPADGQTETLLVAAGEDLTLENGGVDIGVPGGFDEIIEPSEDPSGNRYDATVFAEYLEPLIAYRADFYELPVSLYSYLQSFDPANLVTNKPIITKNMVVMR